MPKYRAEVEYVDHNGRERREMLTIDSATENAEDVAQAAFDQHPTVWDATQGNLPHNINWERVDDDQE